MPYIRIIDFIKMYDGNVKAIDDFSLDIERGEFIVLLGASGCGKSTLLRMIAGLESITSGDFIVDGVDYKAINAQERNIAMVFQDYALYPHMTVYENLAFPLKMRKVGKQDIKSRVLKVAEALHLSNQLRRYPSNLSGGQQQRVAIGRALVRNPAIFLFDEPLSNLDASLREEMRTEIMNLHQKTKAVFIYVTHDQTEAMLMGDKIVVMDNGKVLQIGTPIEVYSHPNCIKVANFIGSPRMNLIARDAFVRIMGANILCSKVPNNGSVGIRPEHIHICSNEDGIPGILLDYEMIGKDTNLKIMIADSTVTVSIRTELKIVYYIEKQIMISFEPDKFIFFDENGNNIDSIR